MENKQELDKEKDEYVKDLHLLARAQTYIAKIFGYDASIDYVISECQNYVRDGKFSKHCYEYAEKELPQLTEAEIAKTLPKTWDGKPIFSYKDLK